MCNTGVKQRCQYAELLCEINFTTEIFVQLLFFCASVSSSLIGITSSCWPQTPGNRSYYDNPRNETPPIYILSFVPRDRSIHLNTHQVPKQPHHQVNTCRRTHARWHESTYSAIWLRLLKAGKNKRFNSLKMETNCFLIGPYLMPALIAVRLNMLH